MLKKIYRLLLGLHLFVGIGAMGGGMMAILFPEGPGGMPVDALNNSPFHDYLIPGIILFAVIGLGNVFCALSLVLKSKYQGYLSSIFSWALVFWIIVQCIMLRAVVSLHVIFFIIGLVEAFLSALLLIAQHLFPTGILLALVKKIEDKYPDHTIINNTGKIVKKIYDADGLR